MNYFKLPNGLWTKSDGTGPYILGSTGYAVVATTGPTLSGGIGSFSKLSSGYWVRDSDGSGPYVQTAVGSFALWSTGGGGSGGSAAWGDIAGTLSAQSDLQSALDVKADFLTPVTLGAGPTAITHADHSNRDVNSNQAGATSVVFAATATSGALGGDLVTIRNIGAGLMTASGAVTAATGYKLTAAQGETLKIAYDEDANAYYSDTVDLSGAAGTSVERFKALEPSLLYLTYPNSGSVNLVHGPALNTIDSSSLTAIPFSAASIYGGISKMQYTQAVAAISRLAGTRGAAPSGTASLLFMPTAAIRFGWQYRVGAGCADAVANGQFGMGLCAAVPAWTNAVQPSAMLNCIFLGWDAGDTQATLMHNDGSGACTKVALNGGTGFPSDTNAADFYSLKIEAASDGATVTVNAIVTNLVSGLEVTVPLTTNLPAAGTPFAIFACRGSANNAASVAIHIGSFAAGEWLK